jgi:ectoine hydroxylase-related dioxygenase (phytanoyl-CoA dioxygenase family)
MATPIRDLTTFAEQLAVEGWASTPPLFSDALLDSLTNNLSSVIEAETGRGGTRHLLDLRSVQDLASSEPARAIAESVLGEDCVAVRGILFDKTPAANWKVTWHQDLTIAVSERREVAGFGPWSVKEGIPHVQPTVKILEHMVAIRVHLDECGPENGPVRLIPGSHKFGRLSGPAIDVWKEKNTAIACTVSRGSILAFFPLLLHSSSPSTRPEHRRVIHLEFAAADLPGGLQWYHAFPNRSVRASA